MTSQELQNKIVLRPGIRMIDRLKTDCMTGKPVKGIIEKVLDKDAFLVKWDHEKQTCQYVLEHVGLWLDIDNDCYDDFEEQIGDRLK